jgi:hypothetical protein
MDLKTGTIEFMINAVARLDPYTIGRAIGGVSGGGGKKARVRIVLIP